MKQQPRIEYLSQEDQNYTQGQQGGNSSGGSPRLRNFVVSFLLSLVLGLIINFSRPAVYQSSATLLTSAATAVDRVSMDVDFQHVTIQKQKLLGVELLSETLVRIHASETDSDYTELTLADVRTMLTVEPISDTNLLSMEAEGPVPEVLPVVINTWIDVYLKARALSVKNSTNETVLLIKSELVELEEKIEQTRLQLDIFRKEHDISSIVREENESPAKLKSLTNTLNQANETVVKSKAKLDAVRQAISQGQAVVPKQDQRVLHDMESRYQRLKEKLAAFDKRFTRDYLEFNAAVKYIPEQLKKLEIEIRERKKVGKNVVRTEVGREYYAAKQVVMNIRQQLDEHKKLAANFTTLFSKHKKLVQDLESMEKINRETRDRLVSLESKQFEKYPQVDVVEYASVNTQSIRPDYLIGTLFVLVISLAFAFFTVWLIEFLVQEKPEQRTFEFNIPTWFTHNPTHESIAHNKVDNGLEKRSQQGLSYLPAYEKISNDDLNALIKNADQNTKLLISLLLTGLTVDEISALKAEDIDLEKSIIQLSGTSARVLLIGEHLHEKLKEAMHNGLLWGNQPHLSEEELNAMLYCSAVDIGLHDRHSMMAETLRQTYIVYLVEQGIRLGLLSKIIGYQAPLDLAGYAEYSPPGEGCEIEKIQCIHPVCG